MSQCAIALSALHISPRSAMTASSGCPVHTSSVGGQIAIGCASRWLQRDRPLEMRDRAVELSQGAQGLAHVVMREGVVGIDGQRHVQIGERVLQPALQMA